MVVQLLQLSLQPLQFLHLLQQRRLLGTDVELYDLHLRSVALVPLLPRLQLLLLLEQLLLLGLVVLLPLLELLLPLLDGLLPLVELLQVVHLHLHVRLVDGDDFLVELLDLFLEVFDFLVHPLDVLLPLSEVFPAFVLLLFEVLFEEAEVAAPFVVDAFAAALAAGGGSADAAA